MLSVQLRQYLHVEMALVDHATHSRTVLRPRARRLRNGHLVLRHYDGTDLVSLFRVLLQRIRVDGNPVTDGEFDLFSVDHFERLALFVIVLARERRAPPEHGLTIRRADDQFGLEDPDRILVTVWFALRVDEEQGDQPVAIGVLG